MRDLIFVGYIALIMLMAFKRPFLFTLIYAYVDIVSPQRLSYFLLNSIPLSLILFALAFLGFMPLAMTKRMSACLRAGSF